MINVDPNAKPDASAAPGATNNAGDGVEMSGSRSAQGRTGSRGFVVLIVSTLAVFLALFGVWALSAGKLAKGGASGGQSGAGALSREFDRTAGSPKQAPSGAPSTEPLRPAQPGAASEHTKS